MEKVTSDNGEAEEDPLKEYAINEEDRKDDEDELEDSNDKV